MNAKKRERSTKEIVDNVEKQINLLELFCQEFDKGNFDVILPMTTAIRVLVKSPKNPKSGNSLLNQVKERFNIKSILFFDSSLFGMNFPNHKGATNIQSNMCRHKVRVASAEETTKISVVPAGDEIRQVMHFEDLWIKQPIIFINDEHIMNRRDVILIVCDQDGGAHFDPSINSYEYIALKENTLNQNVSVIWEINEKRFKLTPDPYGIIQCSIRQIAFEMISTVKRVLNFICEASF